MHIQAWYNLIIGVVMITITDVVADVAIEPKPEKHNVSTISSSIKLKDIVRPVPVNKESEFRHNELFFSVTDKKSHITYANDVFIRVGKYSRADVNGQLHKIIRHPDMPRSVFKVFWDYLLADKPVAAYVKNMAADGSYYWVIALAFPCKGGYLSVRIKPGSSEFHKVSALYAKTLAAEKEAEQSTDKKSAMLVGEKVFIEGLQELGFADYNEFMWSSLQTEMDYREERILELNSDRKSSAAPPELNAMEKLLHHIVGELGVLKQIHSELISHSGYILNLSRSILALSINAQIGSAKLNKDDQSLSVVAMKMGEQSVQGEKMLLHMQHNIHALSNLIGELNFDIISSKLQAETTIFFLEELAGSDSNDSNMLITDNEALELLYDAFLPKTDVIADMLNRLPKILSDLHQDTVNIERFLMALRFIYIKGKVEVARINEQGASFSNTFQELITVVNAANERLNEIASIIHTHKHTVNTFGSYESRIRRLGSDLNLVTKRTQMSK